MADDERQDQDEASEPQVDAAEPEAEQAEAAEPETAEPEAEPDAAEPEAEPEAAEPEAEQAEPQAETAEPEAEPEAAEPEPKAPAGDKPAEEPKLPPGAELTPIQIEPERELTAEERARVEAEAEERATREAAATAEGTEEPVAHREPRVQVPEGQLIQATGKRKNAIARVVVRSGSGNVEVNRRALEEYFPRHFHQVLARQPLVTAGYQDSVDIRVRVHGGGVSGQADAIGHGIARALCEIDPELRPELKRRGLLTRDARIKERRKAGLKKARKRPQFSKR
jgi:small subunit ribosomal protein S9